MAFVMLYFKYKGVALLACFQQFRRIFRRSTPRAIRIAAFLVVKNNVAADFSVVFLDFEIDPWEVIHFSFPGSGERRLRVNWRGGLHEKDHQKRRYMRRLSALGWFSCLEPQ